MTFSMEIVVYCLLLMFDGSFLLFDAVDRSTDEVGEPTDGPVTISNSVPMALFERSERQGFN